MISDLWCCSVSRSCPTLCNPVDCRQPESSVHGILQGENTGVSCHFLLQGIFLTQGSNPCLPQWQADSLPLGACSEHVRWVSDAIQPSHPLSPSPPFAFNLSQRHSFFQWVSSLHQVAKVLEFHFQHQASDEYLGLTSFMKSYFRYCYYIYACISPISRTPNCVFEEITGCLLKLTRFMGSVVGSQPYPRCVPFLRPWLLVNLKCPMHSASCIHEDSLLCNPRCWLRSSSSHMSFTGLSTGHPASCLTVAPSYPGSSSSEPSSC